MPAAANLVRSTQQARPFGRPLSQDEVSCSQVGPATNFNLEIRFGIPVDVALQYHPLMVIVIAFV